jgi:K+-transporting ATPase KdpF subunit
MSAADTIELGIALILLAYLTYALIRPERF